MGKTAFSRATRVLFLLLSTLTLAACATGGSLSREKFSSTVDEYLGKEGHKALALNLTNYSSHYVWRRSTRERAISDALEKCEESSGSSCQLIYANREQIYDLSSHYSGGSDTFGQTVGLFAAFAGALGGDMNLSNQGLDQFARSSGASPPSTPLVSAPIRSSPSSASAPSRSSPSSTGMPAGAQLTGVAAASECTSYLRRQRMQALTNARQCGVQEAWLRSASVDDRSVPVPQGSCRGGLNPSGAQNVSYNKCQLVYGCAAGAYAAAMSYVQRGMPCQEALNAGIRDYPIPQ